MRAILTVLVLGFATMVAGQSNNDSSLSKNVPNSYLNKRASDHFMIQIGYASLAGKPDSITTKGFSRSFNMSIIIFICFHEIILIFRININVIFRSIFKWI